MSAGGDGGNIVGTFFEDKLHPEINVDGLLIEILRAGSTAAVLLMTDGEAQAIREGLPSGYHLEEDMVHVLS